MKKELIFVSFVVQISHWNSDVADFLRQIHSILKIHFEYHEMIVVENYVNEEEEGRALEANRGDLIFCTFVSLTQRVDVEIAMLAGLDRAIGDYIFEVDSPEVDFEPTFLLKLYQKLKSASADIVVGCPRKNIPFTSRLFYSLFNRVSVLSTRHSTERVRLVSRRAVNAVLSFSQKNRYRKALLSLSGYPKAKVPYVPAPHQIYRDPRTSKEKIHLAVDSFISYSSLGSSVALLFCAGFMLMSISSGTFTLYAYFYRPHVEGWTSVMGFLAIACTGIFFILGFMSEYLRQILIEVQSRPLYTLKQQATSHRYGHARVKSNLQHYEANDVKHLTH